MLDVVTLGESLIRLVPPDHRRLESASLLESIVGGAESNTAIGLARMGKQVAWVSRLPDTPLGKRVANDIGAQGVDVGHVSWAAGERLGLYYAERGSSPRPMRIWYDRAGSAASRMTPDDLPQELIATARWLHLTGITPALSPSCAETVAAAITLAHTHKLHVSFDVNYRALLWSPEAAAKVLDPLCGAADVVIIAARDAQTLFGTGEDAEHAVRTLSARWGGTIVLTRSGEGAIGLAGSDLAACPAFEAQVINRIGVGDAFDAGLICRLLEAAPLGEAIRFGAALAALKLTIVEDFVQVSRVEVEHLLAHGASSLHR
jgi:2-dehydro-3-deoxygluconokinase